MKDTRMKTTGDRKLARTIVILAAVILATSCLVGATVARYSAQYQTSDKTRIALWFGEGAVTKELVVDLFDPQYYDVNLDPTSMTDVVSATDELGNQRPVMVNSADGRVVIAPGTTGRFTYDMAEYFTGAPEVRYLIYTDLGSWRTTYGPLTRMKFYVDGVLCGENGTYHEMQYLLHKRLACYNAGCWPVSNELSVITISWEWPFEEDSDGDFYDTLCANSSNKFINEAYFRIYIKAMQINEIGHDPNW